MDNSEKKLHPLLRLAAISGVETAVKLHISRGDNLDARDSGGATPLILAGSRRKKGVVRLLLGAGADPTLVDSDGMDALAHASAAGCLETVALLTEALARTSSSESEVSDLTHTESREPIVESVPDTTPETAQEDPDGLMAKTAPPVDKTLGDTFPTQPSETDGADEKPCFEVATFESTEPEVLSLDDVPLDADFDGDWEAEEDAIAPEGDESVAEVARQVHETIGRHKAVDCDADWGDVDLHLPERAAPLAREEGDGAVRALLLDALLLGMVSGDAIAEVCSNADGTCNEEAERLLAVVVGELGAIVVEWTGVEGPFPGELSIEEERLLNEATEFAGDLASGRNDPFRFYAKDVRGDLLEAEEEIALGREMEEAGRDALAALARWPEGLAMLFDAADMVARGEADAESFSAGPEPSADDEPTVRADLSDDDEDDAGLDDDASAFVTAVAAVRSAAGDVRRAKEALEAARLTRGFLFELTEQADTDPAGKYFAEALERQSVARERMTLCNLRLALSIAKKYLWSALPFDDLVQEANIGLMMAVERYDWRRGFRFSTYATWWIRQRITRSIANTARIVRAPVHVQETARKVIRERDEVKARFGRPDSEVETARRIGMSLAKTRLLLSIFDQSETLDETDTDTGLSRADLLVDPLATDPAELAERASLRSTLLGMLDELDERSRDVIVLRFGLEDQDAMTLEEVGQHFGVTRERIRQIEAKTLRKLSHQNRRAILVPFMGDAYSPRRSSPVAVTEPVETTERPAPSLPLPERAPESKLARESELPKTGVPETRTSVETSRPAPFYAGDLASRLGEKARKLGLKVDDRRSEGGELIIVAPFDSAPTIKAFGRRLLASGFRKVQRDVFAK